MAYLIDRNKLYNHIKTEINPYGKPFEGTAYEFGNKLMDYLLDMEVVDAKPVVHGKWIPVSERLPDGYENAEIEVLISIKEEYFEDLFDETTFALFYPGTGKFHTVYGNGLEIPEEMVVAWMPLPEPYESE